VPYRNSLIWKLFANISCFVYIRVSVIVGNIVLLDNVLNIKLSDNLRDSFTYVEVQ